MKTKFLALSVLAALIGTSQAADIASEVRHNPSNEDGGYFEMGVGLNYIENPRVSDDKDDKDGVSGAIDINGSYRWKGLFAEASHGTLDGLNLGYSFWNNENLSVDFLAASVNGEIDTDNEDFHIPSLSPLARDQALMDRDTFYSGAGLRVTAYKNDYVMQYRLVTDTHGGNGVTSTLRLGKSKQIKNWSLHGIVSAQYRSAKTNQYLFGVTAGEATNRFAAYTPDASVSYSAEMGVTYPVSENWVFRSFARHYALDDEASNSPLLDGDNVTVFVNSINYVF